MSDSASATETAPGGEVAPERRSFFSRAAAGVLSVLLGVVPLASGLVVFFDPLRRRDDGKEQEDSGKMLRVAQLEAVPADGLPHRFPVIDTRVDKWNKYPPQPIDAVFLRRESENEPPKAYSATCPHLGCSVDFKTDRNQYQCPCHNSSWDVSAERIRPESCPSPRDLDELEVEVRNGNEVWVNYKRFRSGIAAKEEV